MECVLIKKAANEKVSLAKSKDILPAENAEEGGKAFKIKHFGLFSVCSAVSAGKFFGQLNLMRLFAVCENLRQILR